VTSVIEPAGNDVLIKIKAVPGASRDEIAGLLGDRLKIRVCAPPEGGKANRTLCRLIARRLAVKGSQVRIEAGDTQSLKTIRVLDLDVERATARLLPSSPPPASATQRP
jgi:uncharacterized protein (TIGR00251 family)